MLSATVNGGFLYGFSMGSRHSGVANISRLLFANDILIFYEANPDHLRYLRVLFLCFEAIFNLKINLATSELFLWVMSLMWMVWLVFWAAGFFFSIEVSWSFVESLL